MNDVIHALNVYARQLEQKLAHAKADAQRSLILLGAILSQQPNLSINIPDSAIRDLPQHFDINRTRHDNSDSTSWTIVWKEPTPIITTEPQ